jgi:hypothetical protein
MDSSLAFRSQPTSEAAASSTWPSWMQGPEARLGHWPDLYMPAACISQDLRQYYTVGGRLDYPGYVAGDRQGIDWIGYESFTRERLEAAARWSAMMEMPHRFNEANGRIELDVEVGGHVRPQVNGSVLPAQTARVPFSPALGISLLRESQGSIPAGVGAVGTGSASLSQPLAFHPGPAVRAAARTRSPVCGEKRKRSASPSPAPHSLSVLAQAAAQARSPDYRERRRRSAYLSPYAPFVSSPEQVAARSRNPSGSSSPPLSPLPPSPHCVYPSPENLARMSSAAGHVFGAPDFGITLPRAGERARAPVAQAPRPGSTQDTTPQRVARRRDSWTVIPPVPLYPWGAK